MNPLQHPLLSLAAIAELASVSYLPTTVNRKRRSVIVSACNDNKKVWQWINDRIAEVRAAEKEFEAQEDTINGGDDES